MSSSYAPDEIDAVMRRTMDRCAEQMDGDGCIVWPGTWKKSPYVRLRDGGRAYNIWRVLLSQMTGEPVPLGIYIRPRCGNTRCLRVAHLEVLAFGASCRAHGAKRHNEAIERRRRAREIFKARAAALDRRQCEDCGEPCTSRADCAARLSAQLVRLRAEWNWRDSSASGAGARFTQIVKRATSQPETRP